MTRRVSYMMLEVNMDLLIDCSYLKLGMHLCMGLIIEEHYLVNF